MSAPTANGVLARTISRELPEITGQASTAKAERTADETDHDPLCTCGHRRSGHAEPSSGDTRCLAVDERCDLLEAFDDGREHEIPYCACLRFTAN